MKQLHKTAVITRCEKYRYKLTRTWDEDKKKVLFVMLNPSTANHIEKEKRLLRPKNLSSAYPGKGFEIYESKKGYKIGVLNLMVKIISKSTCTLDNIELSPNQFNWTGYDGRGL